MAASFELGDLLREAAMGKFPSPTESVTILPQAEGAVGAVIAFGGCNVVACDLPAAEILTQLPRNDLGAPINAAFICWLAGRLRAQAGNHLLVLAALGTSATPKIPLRLREDLNQHPRLERAQRYRTDVRVYSDPAGHAVITIGRGLAGRFEIGVEIEPGARNRGLGREVIRAATALVPSGAPLFAQIAIGNVASTRAFLQAGYRPICAEVLFVRKSGGGHQGRTRRPPRSPAGALRGDKAQPRANPDARGSQTGDPWRGSDSLTVSLGPVLQERSTQRARLQRVLTLA